MNKNIVDNRLFIILAFFVFLLLIFGTTVNYLLQRQSIQQNTTNYITNYEDYFKKTLIYEVNIIHDNLDFLREKQEIINSFLSKDKKSLYENLKPIFDKLNKEIDITHLYFIDKESKVFLRVHDYEKDNDLVDRYTLKKAKETNHITYGLEFGIKKNFTLRLVHPWYVNNELIGYIEMGKEIDKIINQLEHKMNLNMIFAIDKSIYKDANKSILDKLDSSISTNNYIISYSTIKNIHKELSEFIESSTNTLSLKINNKHYIAYKRPLSDVSNKILGKKIILIDMSKEYQQLFNQSIFYLVMMFTGTFLLLIISYFFLKKYQNKLNEIFRELNNEKNRVEKLSNEIIEEKRLLTTILDSSNAIIATIDKNGVMTNINKYGCDFVGYTQEEISSKPYFWFDKFIPSTIKPDIKHLIEAIEKEHKIVSTKTNPWIDKNGVEKSIEWSNSLIYNLKNEIEGIITVGIDISEKQKKEIELREEKDKFKLILENATDGIHILDEKGNIVECSHSFAEMLGYEKEEILQLNVKDWDEGFKKDELLPIIDKLMKKPNFFETKHKKKDGTIFYVEINTSGIIIDGKQCLYASSRDITVQKNAYKKLENFIDLQDNIIILTDGFYINYANKKFFSLTRYKDLNEFKKEFNDISNLFVENDNFFYNGKKENSKNWIEEIQKLPDNERVVAILGKNYNIHAFSLNINYFEDNLYIVTLSDISQTIIEKVNLKRKTLHDKLTDAYNREYFEENYQNYKYIYTEENLHLGIAFFDIDHFKLVNDTYGHKIGDEVLIKFVDLIIKHSRIDDKLIRWGGEEFVMLLKVKTKENLISILENIRKTIEQTNFPVVGNITCSIGATINKKERKYLREYK